MLMVAGVLLVNACGGKKANSEALNKSLEQGRAKYKANDFAGALAEFENAVKADANSAEAYYERGKSHMAIETAPFEKALKDFEKAISLKPDYASVYVSRAALYEQGLKDAGKSCNDAKKAVELYEKQGASNLSATDKVLFQMAQQIKSSCQ